MMASKNWITLLAAVFLALGMLGCNEVEEAAQETGDVMEEAVEKTGDVMEEAAENAIDAGEDAAHEIEQEI